MKLRSCSIDDLYQEVSYLIERLRNRRLARLLRLMMNCVYGIHAGLLRLLARTLPDQGGVE